MFFSCCLASVPSVEMSGITIFVIPLNVMCLFPGQFFFFLFRDVFPFLYFSKVWLWCVLCIYHTQGLLSFLNLWVLMSILERKMAIVSLNISFTPLPLSSPSGPPIAYINIWDNHLLLSHRTQMLLFSFLKFLFPFVLWKVDNFYWPVFKFIILSSAVWSL